MLQSTSAVKVANGVAIDVAYDVLPVWWMEVYPFHFNQSISLLHAEIKWYCYTGQQKKGYKVICLLFYKTEWLILFAYC